jgi:hypothetical protein
MVLRLDLSPEAEARLREKAAALGKDLDRFVLDTLEEKLASGQAETPTIAAETAEQWITRFNSWIESHPKRGYIADDSRDSIYAGRGE